MADLKLIPSNEIIIEGEYRAKLFVPYNSGLSKEDINKIETIVTWEKDLNTLNDLKFSGRSVIINNSSNTNGLQISGVGYLPVHIGINNDSSIGYVGDVFLKPSSKNFLDTASNNHKGSVMGWTIPSSKKDICGVSYYELINNHSAYKPAGTYDYDELSRKIKKTKIISELKFENLVTPKVEAYGYYQGNDLKNNNGPFGFIINTCPKKGKERFTEELFANKGGGFELIKGLSILAKGLRELHDKGYCHLQPHASNFYLFNNKPYLMDWSTAEKLGNDKELNLLYRALDLTKVLNNLETIINATKGSSELIFLGIPSIMGAYVNSDVDFIELSNRAGRYKNDPKVFDATLQLLLDYNAESFSSTPKKLLVKEAQETINNFMKKNRIQAKAPKIMNKYERAKIKK